MSEQEISRKIENMLNQRQQLQNDLGDVEKNPQIIQFKQKGKTTPNIKDFYIFLSAANRHLRLIVYDKFCSDVNKALTSIMMDHRFTHTDIDPILEQEKKTKQRHHALLVGFINPILTNMKLDDDDKDYELLLTNLDKLYKLWFDCFFNIVAFINFIPIALQTKDRTKVLDFLHTYIGDPKLKKDCNISSLVKNPY